MVNTFGLTHLAMAVQDVERTYSFYSSVFGLAAYFREQGRIHAKTPGQQDVITFDQTAPFPGQMRGIKHFGFRLQAPEDIEVALVEVVNAGGRVLRRGDFGPGFPYAYVADPDGYEVEIWFE